MYVLYVYIRICKKDTSEYSCEYKYYIKVNVNIDVKNVHIYIYMYTHKDTWLLYQTTQSIYAFVYLCIHIHLCKYA